MTKLLDGHTALITGGGSGIGKSSALALLDEGYCVAVAGRRQERLQEVVDEAGGAAERVLAVQTDVTDPASVKNLFDRTIDTTIFDGRAQ